MAKKQTKSRVVEALRNLGLGENESLLYSLLLTHPKSTVQELQVRTPFPRTILYYVLNNLQEAGLVTREKAGWRTEYIVENPDRLYELLDKRGQEFKNTTLTIQEIIPELKAAYRLSSKRPDTSIFQGIHGYQSALEDILRSNPKIIYYYKHIGTPKIPGLEVQEDFEVRRLNKRLPLNILVENSTASLEWIRKQPLNDYTWHRLGPNNLKIATQDIYLYNSKMLYVTHDGREPIILLLEDQNLITMQSNLFQFIWELSNTPRY